MWCHKIYDATPLVTQCHSSSTPTAPLTCDVIHGCPLIMIEPCSFFAYKEGVREVFSPLHRGQSIDIITHRCITLDLTCYVVTTMKERLTWVGEANICAVCGQLGAVSGHLQDDWGRVRRLHAQVHGLQLHGWTCRLQETSSSVYSLLTTNS